MSNSLKTITIPKIPDASIELATELKNKLGWFNKPEEIQAILRRGSHTKVIEHLQPQYVDSVTSVLASLGLEFTVYDDESAPR